MVTCSSARSPCWLLAGRDVLGRTVLADRDEYDISSTGDSGAGNNAACVGWPTDGLDAEESFDLREPFGVYDDLEGWPPWSCDATEVSGPRSKENSDLGWTCSSLLGLAEGRGEGTGRSMLFFPSIGGVPANMGSCHSK